MATWIYTPQEVFEERYDTAVAQTLVSPLRDWAGQDALGAIRGFQLRFALVTSANAAGMAAFYTARRGPYESFGFTNPNDRQDYLVRFDEAMTLELFTPIFFRTGTVPFVVVG